ncbi:TetR family transcriptional regulator [Acrocarpospora pleiomorpha]|uniref:TetR family transcriptional regulator n=1 Tax=Acrocarpospora pleiomorpha TaxID=90975 RepID=A0A5M3XNT7_9ACTN|nr:TetR family transcriptional regulator [Acrocarpospora pleiomorpha]GES21769.1 TetR family transcriptional regulator [Acrocarpospora pleiomorpha]
MAALDAETIMRATEDVLRRYGPAKATVVDVARQLGVSHAAVYRHFPSKAALREAVARRWLTRVYDDTVALAGSPRQSAAQRLTAWLMALHHAKVKAAIIDPELFATYRVLLEENSTATAEHISALVRGLAEIVADGVAAGAFASTDPAATARAIFQATTAFHHPAHVAEWQRPNHDRLLTDVCTLIVNGLCPVPVDPRSGSAARESAGKSSRAM